MRHCTEVQCDTDMKTRTNVRDDFETELVRCILYCTEQPYSSTYTNHMDTPTLPLLYGTPVEDALHLIQWVVQVVKTIQPETPSTCSLVQKVRLPALSGGIIARHSQTVSVTAKKSHFELFQKDQLQSHLLLLPSRLC